MYATAPTPYDDQQHEHEHDENRLGMTLHQVKQR
jgi:hypothetical protein